MTKDYRISLEIAGPAAMFTRPDSGAAPVSYPAPTYSAVKGIFEAIARLKSAYIRPTVVEICRPVQFHRYTCNYSGPLRKRDQIAKQNAYQHPAVILVDVCYRLYGVTEEVAPAPVPMNHLHALQEIFMRRLARGQFFAPPCLGWREFVPDYCGPLRAGTQIESSINLTIPSMLFSVFDKPINGQPSAIYKNDVRVVEGVLRYAD